MAVVGTHFRPEFINRVDESVVFHPLAIEQIRGIAAIQLRSLQARLAERDLTLELSDAFMDRLVAAGYEPDYGARPLKRAIQRELETLIAQAVLEGRIRDGQHIQVSAVRGVLTVEEKTPARSQ
jgi:ATP-dependent Clp protease ATP-binding subunit ClpB